MNNFTHLEKYFDVALQELARTALHSEIAWVIVVYLFSYLLAVVIANPMFNCGC